MICRLLKFLAQFSLALCIATALLWVRSYWVEDEVSRDRQVNEWKDAYEQHSWSLRFSRGRFYFFHGTNCFKPREWASDPGWDYSKSRPRALEFIDDQSTHRFDRLGVGAGAFHFGAVTGVEAMWPHWLVCFGAILLPAARFGTKRQLRHRVALNLCSTCGYDLRASPNRCPECGAKAP
ncbi:MAG: hypothetical protein JWO87_3208 [Phycisphaerales bacterium]|nr:hypothetical protein [Phycisphaerales bacterium]